MMIKKQFKIVVIMVLIYNLNLSAMENKFLASLLLGPYHPLNQPSSSTIHDSVMQRLVSDEEKLKNELAKRQAQIVNRHCLIEFIKEWGPRLVHRAEHNLQLRRLCRIEEDHESISVPSESYCRSRELLWLTPSSSMEHDVVEEITRNRNDRPNQVIALAYLFDNFAQSLVMTGVNFESMLKRNFPNAVIKFNYGSGLTFTGIEKYKDKHFQVILISFDE